MEDVIPQKISDHDLLITLNVRVQDLIETIRRMETVTVKDIGGLKEAKLDKSEFATHAANDLKEHEMFIKNINRLFEKTDAQSRFLWVGVGIVAAIQFIAPFLIKYL